MDNYKIISNTDNIILKKNNNNKYKLNFITTVNKSCNIINIIEQNKLYELLYLLNKDLIKSQQTTNCSNNSEDILIILNKLNENNDDADDDQYNKLYITSTNNIKIHKNTVEIKGKKNNFMLNDNTYKKFEIDNLNINLNLLNDGKIEVELSFKYIGEQLPLYIENIIGFFFKKILCRLKLYFE